MLMRRAFPLLLLLIGLWLLAGCFYLPLPEHVTGHHQPDFRNAVGNAASKRPLRTGVTTRQQVIALLGEPPFATADGRSIAYLLHTTSSAWIFPLCFTATTAHEREYAVRLDFNDHDMLAGWQMVHEDQNRDWLFYAFPVNGLRLIEQVQQGRSRLMSAWERKPRSGAATLPTTQPDAARKRAG
jgi:hypothetical protein